MDIILKENVENLGDAGELVTVKPGYGRNYLIPQGKAILATASAKKMLEENQRQRAHKEEKLVDEAKNNAAKLNDMSLKIGAKVGDQGKIFGSVNTIQVAEAIKKLGVDIDRKNISINQEPIKSVGEYEATIKFHKDVVETVKFEVVGE
ncbi:50S ribosomal protein L9 [Salibacter sp.]|jgi:large subunit ribosomal protein L9|uniref:50S ribosomal protein L9 n=1 Tax=Salibacter sp. TaxID=2010995 RepID=UPI0028701123|nr:50S ribosomal protein L9 [Salibacter sp.]MDR9397553.1 50S ribosomal protein L9 [Salibacter sp.]MDR9486969.1 50S ribosomal protein L9 [Salibacter sp.]